jgi:hypothetical protein
MFRKSVIFAIWPSVMLGLMEKFEFLKISGELQTAGRRERLPLREAFVRRNNATKQTERVRDMQTSSALITAFLREEF